MALLPLVCALLLALAKMQVADGGDEIAATHFSFHVLFNKKFLPKKNVIPTFVFRNNKEDPHVTFNCSGESSYKWEMALKQGEKGTGECKGVVMCTMRLMGYLNVAAADGTIFMELYSLLLGACKNTGEKDGVCYWKVDEDNIYQKQKKQGEDEWVIHTQWKKKL